MFLIDGWFFTFYILSGFFSLFFRKAFFIWLWIGMFSLIKLLSWFLIELFYRVFLFSNLLRGKRWRARSWILMFIILDWLLVWSFWFAVWKCFYFWVWSAAGLLFWFWFWNWWFRLILFPSRWWRGRQIKIALYVIFWSYKLFITLWVGSWFTPLLFHKVIC